MTFMRTTEWDEWRETWHGAAGDAPDAEIQRKALNAVLRRQRSVVMAQRVASVALLAIVVAALRHAAAPFELALGMGVIAIVATSAAFQEWRRVREQAALTAAASHFVATVRAIRRSEIRFARLLWSMLGVEIVFFGVWWYGGLGLHHSLMTPIALGTVWLPLVTFGVLARWALTLGRAAREDLERLDHSAREPDDA
jgi:hypothetical protein